MQIKCPHCDLTVKTATSVVLWLDLIVCSCIAFVELSKTQAVECFNGLSDCSNHYHIAEYLLINITVAALALCAVRQKMPSLLFPYVASKTVLIVVIVVLFVVWMTRADSALEFHGLLPKNPDLFYGISLFIILAFQFYAIFVMIWSYNATIQVLKACRTTKSFKSIVSIWIGDDSRTNMCSNDSTCMIDTETRSCDNSNRV